MSEKAGSFGEVAARLAGIAGWQLGWSADAFWSATPAEMAAVVKAMLGIEGGGEGALTATKSCDCRRCFPMDEEIDRLVISVRADTQGFARDVADMRAGLEGPLAAGADRAGKAIEGGLLRAVRSGKFGFEDLRRVALSALNAIAQEALSAGLGAIGLGGGGLGGGLLGGVLNIASAALGAPGRATGGPVTAGRAYRVGENGPELFVPGSNGRIIAAGAGGGARDVRVTINVNAPETGAPQALARSSRQIARSVRSALAQ